jgi:uncharacterized membrane protein YhhN
VFFAFVMIHFLLSQLPGLNTGVVLFDAVAQVMLCVAKADFEDGRVGCVGDAL